MSNSEEFQKIRQGIEAAADCLGGAIERHGGNSWDYLIVAVPVGRGISEIGMMSSVMPPALPKLLAFLLHQYKSCEEKGRIIDDRTEGMKAS